MGPFFKENFEYYILKFFAMKKFVNVLNHAFSHNKIIEEDRSWKLKEIEEKLSIH